MRFQNHSGAYWLTISPPFMNLMFDPTFTHITKVMLTVSYEYFAHKIIFKNRTPDTQSLAPTRCDAITQPVHHPVFLGPPYTRGYDNYGHRQKDFFTAAGGKDLTCDVKGGTKT